MPRKIEERMLAAIKEEKRFKTTNTEVVPVFSGDRKIVLRVKVYLFGNHIATVSKHDRTIILHTCGWDTITTTSRMNAILGEFTRGAYYVTCRTCLTYLTYDKTYRKELRLNKICDSDWKVTLGY